MGGAEARTLAGAFVRGLRRPADVPVRLCVLHFQDLASILDGVKEFAIDLEAHSYRSYQGFTCLMQVGDWIGNSLLFFPTGSHGVLKV
jgi:hypothetical protein